MAVHLWAGLDEASAVLAGRNVVTALWRGETPEAARDWLVWHRARAGADGALICLGPEADAHAFVGAATDVAGDMEVVIVAGRASMEELRRLVLGRARAVAAMRLSDLVMPDRLGNPFDRALGATGRVVPLIGTEVFPWRLRQGKPAPHVDHVAMRQTETRQATGWAVAPAGCPEGAVWGEDGIDGMEMAEGHPVEFRRAVGVARPGVTVGKLVRKAELVESPVLVDILGAVFPEKVRSRARPAQCRAVAPSRQVTIVTTMKNEGPFILDWIAHHRAIGVERFLVYTNDCDDGTDGLLDRLGAAGVVRRDNPYRETGRVPQHAAFRAAEGEAAVAEAEWLLTLDVDEYINIHAGAGRLGDLFAQVPEAGAISMPWRLFGNADVHGFEDRPVVQQFAMAAPEYAPRPMQAWAFKTLYRNDGTFGRLGVHRPKAMDKAKGAKLRWVDGAGRALPSRMWRAGWRMTCETWGYDLVSVNHYAVRSAESFLVKRDRGRVNHVTSEQGTAYWFRMNHNVVEDRSIRRLDDVVAGERARLAALPGVAEAHRAAVDWHRGRIAELKRDPDMAALYSELTGSRLEGLSRITPNFGSSVFYAGPEVIPEKVAALGTGRKFYFSV